MARPRPTPLPEGSTQNMAIEEIRLKSSEPVQTGHQQGKRRAVGERAALQQSLLLCYRRVDDKSTSSTPKKNATCEDVADAILRHVLVHSAYCRV